MLLAVRGEASDSMDLCAARVAADGRLSAAIDSTVDCDGSTFFEEIRACIREIRATTDSMRHAARDARVAAERKPDLSHMSQLERDYHREVRAMFDAQRGAACAGEFCHTVALAEQVVALARSLEYVATLTTEGTGARVVISPDVLAPCEE